jgi:hypothetical protein
MNKTISYTETLTVVVCTCGINFAVPASLHQQALDHRGPGGKHIYCPLGHAFHYTGKTDDQRRADRLAAELETQRGHAASLTALLDQEKAGHAATKGQLTKTRKRVAAGVCPVCHRGFVQLQRHMSGQHPGFGHDHG